MKSMMAEIYGRTTGACHGEGGFMRIADLIRGAAEVGIERARLWGEGRVCGSR
ncbi:hypothetical protein ACFVXC_27620 [Streptomyces sp. NPDC058257]|uniref:hypothetical protein n=1 Tax=Streptomyces sp. NPDC058257 TaxID=3346409 RepID=UPI0036E3D72F